MQTVCVHRIAVGDAAILHADKIARRIEQSVMDDLARQHTAREFAAQFSISESSVKNYFSGVFGQSISQYTVHRRMELAA